MRLICEVTHRHVTACHYREGAKYMIWYYKEHEPNKTIGIFQIRGLSASLTEKEVREHIDKLWDRYKAQKGNACC